LDLRSKLQTEHAVAAKKLVLKRERKIEHLLEAIEATSCKPNSCNTPFFKSTTKQDARHSTIQQIKRWRWWDVDAVRSSSGEVAAAGRGWRVKQHQE
jgi:hypothetical protein